MNAGEVADPLGAAPRLAALQAAIATRARDCDRDPAAVTLVAVSKTYSADEVWPTIAIGGQTIFGGPLQSNKAGEAVELFDAIETVDRDKIAQALAAAMAKAGKRPRLFVEVNTGAEPQKAGIGPRDADAFLARCRDVHGLAIEGLMCVPPAGEPASPHFALLKVIAERNGIKQLSMGMSGDWPLAVPLGATEVRVGSAIFGART